MDRTAHTLTWPAVQWPDDHKEHTMYIIQRNDGSTWRTSNKGEARLWAMLAVEYSLCNVYDAASGTRCLLACEIV